MMKTLNRIAIILFSLTLIGCSSLGGLIPTNPASYVAYGVDSQRPLHPALDQNKSKSFEVFNHHAYAVNIGFEKPATDPIRTPIRGDGGASLNAYAACLTLKVMF